MTDNQQMRPSQDLKSQKTCNKSTKQALHIKCHLLWQLTRRGEVPEEVVNIVMSESILALGMH